MQWKCAVRVKKRGRFDVPIKIILPIFVSTSPKIQITADNVERNAMLDILARMVNVKKQKRSVNPPTKFVAMNACQHSTMQNIVENVTPRVMMVNIV